MEQQLRSWMSQKGKQMSKIQVGYGGGNKEGFGRGSYPKGTYGPSRRQKITNGGFSTPGHKCPTVDYTRISEEKWNRIFKNK